MWKQLQQTRDKGEGGKNRKKNFSNKTILQKARNLFENLFRINRIRWIRKEKKTPGVSKSKKFMSIG